jgi:hypothetical protein
MHSEPFLPPTLIVLGVRQELFDVNTPVSECHANDQPIPIASNVEYREWPNHVSIRKSPSNILQRLPNKFAGSVEPNLDGSHCIRVSPGFVEEHPFADDVHTSMLAKC